MDTNNKNKHIWGFYNAETSQHKPANENPTTKICIITALTLIIGFTLIHTVHSLQNTGTLKVITGTIRASINNPQYPPILIIPLTIALLFTYLLLSDKIMNMTE